MKNPILSWYKNNNEYRYSIYIYIGSLVPDEL